MFLLFMPPVVQVMMTDWKLWGSFTFIYTSTGSLGVAISARPAYNNYSISCLLARKTMFSFCLIPRNVFPIINKDTDKDFQGQIVSLECS